MYILFTVRCRPTSEISSEFASPEKALESLSNHQDFTLYGNIFNVCRHYIFLIINHVFIAGMSTSEDFWVSSIKKAERKMQTLSSPKNEVNSLAYDVDTLHSI